VESGNGSSQHVSCGCLPVEAAGGRSVGPAIAAGRGVRVGRGQPRPHSGCNCGQASRALPSAAAGSPTHLLAVWTRWSSQHVARGLCRVLLLQCCFLFGVHRGEIYIFAQPFFGAQAVKYEVTILPVWRWPNHAGGAGHA
jgi:hypothetical protein